ncbi:hypothetical protein TNCV_1063561 [Trichonephila clavipes]|nr:hypothetical protein TNCV_1063561 [Trichonephila clavipes]
MNEIRMADLDTLAKQDAAQRSGMEGFTRFRKGPESVSGNFRCGRLATSLSDENIEKVRKLLTKDRRLTVLMIADEQQIKRESVQQIITQYLDMYSRSQRYIVMGDDYFEGQQGSFR